MLDSAMFGKLAEDRFVLRRSIIMIYPNRSETPIPLKGTFSAKFQSMLSVGQENGNSTRFATSWT